MRSGLPMLPTNTVAVCIPDRILIGGYPNDFHSGSLAAKY